MITYSPYNKEYEEFLLSDDYKKYLEEIKIYKAENEC